MTARIVNRQKEIWKASRSRLVMFGRDFPTETERKGGCRGLVAISLGSRFSFLILPTSEWAFRR